MFEGFSLTIAEGGKKPADIQLADFGAATVTFGRNAANDVVLDSPIASNFHGALAFEAGPGGGAVFIIDKNSTNGIYVNGARVSGKARLRPGDAVTFESERARQAARGEHGAVMTLNASRAGAGEGVWSSARIGGRPLTVGRDASCDIALSQASVSRLHARITAEGGGCFFIQDCGSANGVYVNGARVSGRRELADRDAIFVGSARLVYAGGVVHYNVEQPALPIEVVGARKTVLAKGRPRDILDGVSFSLAPNELAAIIGGSGAGKSTLMNGMCGFAPFTSGSVLFGGEDLRANYGALKNLIGYVPQQDIVHRDLALRPMLLYTAEMRMPADSTARDRESRVARAIETVELSGREDAQIRMLSGGQRKRASIAVELVSDPCAFFLDEPSSGLDPGTERHLMQMLKNMAGRGKTVVLVTHMTANIGLCDKLAILGAGGRLCFFGAPGEALAFFGVRDFADIYDKIGDSPAQWKLRYEALHRPKAAPQAQAQAGAERVAPGAQAESGAQVELGAWQAEAGAYGAAPGAPQAQAGAQGAAQAAGAWQAGACVGAYGVVQGAQGAAQAGAYAATPMAGARQAEAGADGVEPGDGLITRAWAAPGRADGGVGAGGGAGFAVAASGSLNGRAAASGSHSGRIAPRAARAARRGGNSALRQFSVLCRRYAALVAADKKRLALLLLQAPLLGLLLSLVSYSADILGEVTVFRYSQQAKPFLFSLSCAAFWLGMLNAVQEICKERDILKRERLAGCGLAPYLLSKLAVLGAMCALQSLLLLLTVRAVVGPFPANGMGISPFGGMYATTLLTAFSATALGLAVSGLSPNPDRAMTLAPLVLMPQILFSGVAFDLSGFADFLSGAVNCKWSVVGYCVLADINGLPATAESTGTTFENVAYAATRANLFGAWGVLLFIALACSALCAAALHVSATER